MIAIPDAELRHLIEDAAFVVQFAPAGSILFAKALSLAERLERLAAEAPVHVDIPVMLAAE